VIRAFFISVFQKIGKSGPIGTLSDCARDAGGWNHLGAKHGLG
jgi:hypothetical protein